MGAKEDNLSQYAEYNKTLRAWLVGFGFGVPALFIVNDAAQLKLIASQDATVIIWLFLIGAAALVIMAFLNKIVSWCAYYKHDNEGRIINSFVTFFASLENAFIVDVVFDLISLVAFTWSIILIVGLFM